MKDHEWCGDKGRLGATCFNTLSEGRRDIKKAEWDEERFGMLCTKAESFGDWKAVILKLCKLTGRCSFDTKTKVIAFEKNVNNFVLAVNEKENNFHEVQVLEIENFDLEKFDEEIESADVQDLSEGMEL